MSRNSLARRSAQTALFLILDAMAKLFAPILAFTCNEIWLAMPHRDGDDGRNVLLNEMRKHLDASTPWPQDAMAELGYRHRRSAQRCQRRPGSRPGPTSALARRWKPRSTSIARATRKTALDAIQDLDLAELFIVSRVSFCDGTPDRGNVVEDSAAFPGLTIEVCEAAGAKCPRCWMHTLEPNAEGLCPRCAQVMALIPAEELES